MAYHSAARVSYHPANGAAAGGWSSLQLLFTATHSAQEIMTTASAATEVAVQENIRHVSRLTRGVVRAAYGLTAAAAVVPPTVATSELAVVDAAAS